MVEDATSPRESLLHDVDANAEALTDLAEVLDLQTHLHKLERHLSRETVRLVEAIDVGQWDKLGQLYHPDRLPELEAAIAAWSPKQRAPLKRKLLGDLLKDAVRRVGELPDGPAAAWLTSDPAALDALMHAAAPWVGDLKPLLALRRERSAASCRAALRLLEEFRLRIALDAPVGEPDPKTRAEARRAASRDKIEQEVKACVLSLAEELDGDSQRITRDRIAYRTGLSGGTVSGTDTWKRVAELKRQERAPRSRGEAALRAAERGDWSEVERLQAEELGNQVRALREQHS